jgi:hypothetical protein
MSQAEHRSGTGHKISKEIGFKVYSRVLMRMMWAEHVARMGKKNTAYRLLVGKPEGKR